MATRINVTAIRHCPPDEVRAVMSEVIRPACAGTECQPVGDLLEIHEHNGWVWFATSVWGVSVGDLNRGLCKLGRPALQLTTSDGDRWYLTVHGGPQGPVQFLHEFGYHCHAPDPAEDAACQERLENREEPPSVDPRLAFLEDDPVPGPDRPKAPIDLLAEALSEMGAQIPEEFRASLAHLPYSAAASRYREWHADQVSSALTAASIPHDPAAVRSVLLWENGAGADGGDLGNLPWLLSVLGLGGQWDEYIRQAEAPTVLQPEPEPEPEVAPVAQSPPQPTPAPRDLFGPVLTLIEPLGVTPVTGGPFALPLDDLTVIRFFVEALSIFDTAGVVLTVILPEDYDPARIPAPNEEEIESVELMATGFRAAMDNHLWFSQKDLTNQLGEKLAHLLYHLPDGSILDVAFALADKPALTQHYRGLVASGQWRIGETFPPLTREALAGGMELARYALSDPEKHKLRDEADAQAVVEMAREDPNLWDMKVHRNGRMVWCSSDICGHLVKVIFRQRFQAHWDVAAHDQAAAPLIQERREMQRKFRRGNAEAARRRAAPHDDEILFRGKCGHYWRSDFARLDQLEQETREKIDSALAALGFRHVGDLVAKKQRDIVLRAYVSSDGLSYGMLLAKRLMYLGCQLFTRFVDGSILITTANAAEESQPEVKVYYKACPGLELAGLHAKHLWGIERIRTRKHTEPAPLAPTLLGMAQEYDRALARRHGVSLRIRILAASPGEAPAEIRAAWIGCVLPVFATTDDPRVGRQMKGVLSGQKEEHFNGFTVRGADAIAVLEGHNAAAARWWRENAPHGIQPGKLFAFPGESCELVEEIDREE
jgi:hypothetical protein